MENTIEMGRIWSLLLRDENQQNKVIPALNLATPSKFSDNLFLCTPTNLNEDNWKLIP